jgi:transcriptional regulator with XRE-family HTH domain
MDFRLLIRQRLRELGTEQRNLAAAAQVTESYISQLLRGKKAPPAPERTDIYDKMEMFLKLPAGKLATLAHALRTDTLKRKLGEPPPPLFKKNARVAPQMRTHQSTSRPQMFLVRVAEASGSSTSTSRQRRCNDAIGSPGKARALSVGIALAPADIAASWQVRGIRAGQQSGERIETHLIDRLHYDHQENRRRVSVCRWLNTACAIRDSPFPTGTLANPVPVRGDLVDGVTRGASTVG